MKRFSIVLMILTVMLVMVSCATATVADTGAAVFEIGEDYVEGVAEGATAYSPIYEINFRLVGPEEDILFSGKIKLQTNAGLLNDYVLAAVKAKNLEFVENEAGYISQIGDYVNNDATWTYWMLYLNGAPADFGPMSQQVRTGDFIEYRYEAYSF